MKTNTIHSALFGLAVGDALGVPVEFKDRDYLKQFPVVDMMEYGSHHQPKGTWSDDSSLAFCLAESLCKRYDINDIGQKFVQWAKEELWTPHGRVFDIGISTDRAIYAIETGTKPILAGGSSEMDNGNGSLMRILPLLYYIKDLNIEKRFDIIKDVSSITHAHIRAVLACFIYLEYARHILNGSDKWNAYAEMQKSVTHFLNTNAICSQIEMDKFHKILELQIGKYEPQVLHKLEESEISSSGYVLDSLEASLWCILTSNSYKETVLKAVNLGRDTDTTGAIAGGLAGLIYGYEAIPEKWLNVISRKEDIIRLCDRLYKTL
ncbi:ADP-ribosylglycohydrolase family protein [uncultured Psychroserpens sp.]|uniref:ADP-ribosylglycohydrolase family protein n=1 Tax=uncultured Psychroserpens sp. TaxID=255436 RepID=UPI00260A3D66|nr:ADP-ribosylglycohydrolase family protein [uncultured Psychroserpens sp.]